MSEKLFGAAGGTYIDRRGENTSRGPVIRERFSNRVKGHLRQRVADLIQERSIADIANGADVSIPKRDLSEPTFRPIGGERTGVRPGNDKFRTGDRVPRGEGGGKGNNKGNASNDGEGEDDFIYTLSKEEVLDIFFEDLALPNLTKRKIDLLCEHTKRRGGVTTSGTPSSLDVFRTKKQGIMRRVGANGALRDAIADCERKLAEVVAEHGALHPDARKLADDLEELKKKRPVALDEVDLRYRALLDVPKPMAKAVVFLLMDVSGSMGEEEKDIAKRFFILLYLFLERMYGEGAVKLEFIRHHTTALRCTEEEFFTLRESGGTVVSSGLALINDIVKKEYAGDNWNVYVAQASDGDNYASDNDVCEKLMQEELLPLLQYFAYLEIAANPQELWAMYVDLEYDHHDMFGMARAQNKGEIWPAFRSLFQRHGIDVHL